MAEILGLKIEIGKKEYVTVGNGLQIPVYLHRLKIELASGSDIKNTKKSSPFAWQKGNNFAGGKNGKNIKCNL